MVENLNTGHKADAFDEKREVQTWAAGRLSGVELGAFQADRAGDDGGRAGLWDRLSPAPFLPPPPSPPRLFFRRHYPLATLRFCGMDPEHRK